MLKRDGRVGKTFESQANAIPGNAIDINDKIGNFSEQNANFTYWTSSEGSLVFKLKLTLTKLPDVRRLKEEAFQIKCQNEVCQNLATILDDTLSSDVKIITKDKIELQAHKLILRARCPIFASMFGSEFLESRTGLVNVDDISAKTMKILLKYWYSGELLPSWKDNDIVVEYTYAAGKYQMTGVLEMLDESLGLDFKASDSDVELLKMVQNLSLKNAEAGILKRVVKKISQAQSGAEILNLFSFETDELDEESLSSLQILKTLDNALSINSCDEACYRDVEQMALAGKFGMKNVEVQLLKRIIRTVNKMSSAVELFALFEKNGEI